MPPDILKRVARRLGNTNASGRWQVAFLHERHHDMISGASCRKDAQWKGNRSYDWAKSHPVIPKGIIGSISRVSLCVATRVGNLAKRNEKKIQVFCQNGVWSNALWLCRQLVFWQTWRHIGKKLERLVFRVCSRVMRQRFKWLCLQSCMYRIHCCSFGSARSLGWHFPVWIPEFLYRAIHRWLYIKRFCDTLFLFLFFFSPLQLIQCLFCGLRS